MSRRGVNEGSIYEMSDGRWRAAVTTGWKTNAAGQPVQTRKVYTGRTRDEVAKKLTKALSDIQKGLPLAGERQTVAQFLQVWLDEVAKANVRPSTLASYTWLVKKHLMPGLGRFSLAKLSPQQLQTFLNDRLKSGRQPLPRRRKADAKPETPKAPANPALTPRTVQHMHATLRAALDQAEKWGLVARNVARLVDAPRVRRPEVQPLTPEQAKSLLAAVRDNRLEALYSVGVAMGLRQGEVLGLRWPDIDFEKGTLSVRSALQRVNGKLQLVEVKTSRSRRTIRLPQVAVSALLRHRARQEQERQFAGERWHETGHVFTTTIGTPLEGPTVTHRFQLALKAAGLPRFRFHDLRHTCATLLLAQGVAPRLIMEILGHSQIAVTMNLYAHVLPTMQVEVAAKMDAVLAPENPVATSVATRAPAEVVPVLATN